MKDSLLWILEETLKWLTVQDRVYLNKFCNKFPVISFNLDNMQVCETHKKITIWQRKYFTEVAQNMNPIIQSLYYSVQSVELNN